MSDDSTPEDVELLKRRAKEYALRLVLARVGGVHAMADSELVAVLEEIDDDINMEYAVLAILSTAVASIAELYMEEAQRHPTTSRTHDLTSEGLRRFIELLDLNARPRA